MPPKRKRAQPDANVAETPSRPTQSSTRSAKKAAQGVNATLNNSTRQEAPGEDNDEETSVSPNRASKSGERKVTKTRSAKKPRKRKSQGEDGCDDEPARLKSDARRGVSDTMKHDMYSEQRADALFSQFADTDIPDVIGAEGFERLCNEAQVPLDGTMPLLLAWQFDSHEMGKISKQEWMGGTASLRVSSLASIAIVLNDLNNLIVLGKPVAGSRSSSKAQKGTIYDRTRYDSYAADTRKAFSSFYSFCFALAKPENSRNIDMETACALWSVVLGPQFPLITDVIEFINETKSHKGANKDVWKMMYEFCRDTRRDLSNFDVDGAWPTVIDEFVRWKTAQTAAIQPTATSAGDV